MKKTLLTILFLISASLIASDNEDVPVIKVVHMPYPTANQEIVVKQLYCNRERYYTYFGPCDIAEKPENLLKNSFFYFDDDANKTLQTRFSALFIRINGLFNTAKQKAKSEFASLFKNDGDIIKEVNEEVFIRAYTSQHLKNRYNISVEYVEAYE